jgi:uncharacterized protein with GYD domain
MEETMLIRSLMVVPVLAIGLAVPGFAQQSSSMHYYMVQFKRTPQAARAMIENPQDRTVPVRKLLEGFGGKLVNFFFSLPGEYDGVLIAELPDDVSAQAATMTAIAGGDVVKLNVTPLMTMEEAKLAMEKAKEIKSGYIPAIETK